MDLPGRILRATLVVGVPANWLKQSLVVVQTLVSLLRLINLSTKWIPFYLFVEAANLIQTAVTTSRLAQAQVFDARLNKQPAPVPSAIHTMAGLSTARVNNTPTGENKIFITIECHIKSSLKREQNSTDVDCGSWGKPWSKEDYLTGTNVYFHSHLWSYITYTFVSRGSWWLACDVELTLVPRHGMELVR